MNVSEMSPQEVFDTIVTHLFTQRRRSMTSGEPFGYGYPICAYRGEQGTKCAAGALIPDERYDPSMEGRNVNDSRVAEVLGFELIDDDGRLTAPADDPRFRVIDALQAVHDDRTYWESPKVLADECTYVADRFDLSVVVLTADLVKFGVPFHG